MKALAYLLSILLSMRIAVAAPNSGTAGCAIEVADASEPAPAAKSVHWEKRSSFGPGRILHSAVWTYAEMIVWGGGSEHQFYNNGGIYDPVTDQWRPMTEREAPSGRWGHAAVWTGTEMIVWGGRSSFAPANHRRDGAIYDPRTDTWRPMTMEGAPNGRSQMAAAWAGEELIIWGGWADDGQCPATGASYNPRTDRWTELPVENAPEGRMEPGCVWTGRELIVWGGLLQGEQRATATGARYNPETRKWTPLPKEDAPTPVRGHHATWTGSTMIVWGGANLDGASPVNIGTNTGAIYTPESNRWRAIPIPDAVDGRLYHVATWTGTDLVVWGGGDQQKGCLSSGGRFDPETDRWRSISEKGSPTARSMSTAVWTGEGMLIYGGSTGGSAAFGDTYHLRLGSE